MHKISSYRGNRPTHTHPCIHKQTGPITIHCATASARCNNYNYNYYNYYYNNNNNNNNNYYYYSLLMVIFHDNPRKLVHECLQSGFYWR